MKDKKKSFISSDSDRFEKYKKTISLIHVIQHPCLWLASFCLSFLFFSSIIYRAKLPTSVFVLILTIGLIGLVTGLVTGRIEKKLFQQHINEFIEKTQSHIRERQEKKDEK